MPQTIWLKGKRAGLLPPGCWHAGSRGGDDHVSLVERGSEVRIMKSWRVPVAHKLLNMVSVSFLTVS